MKKAVTDWSETPCRPLEKLFSKQSDVLIQSIASETPLARHFNGEKDARCRGVWNCPAQVRRMARCLQHGWLVPSSQDLQRALGKGAAQSSI